VLDIRGALQLSKPSVGKLVRTLRRLPALNMVQLDKACWRLVRKVQDPPDVTWACDRAWQGWSAKPGDTWGWKDAEWDKDDEDSSDSDGCRRYGGHYGWPADDDRSTVTTTTSSSSSSSSSGEDPVDSGSDSSSSSDSDSDGGSSDSSSSDDDSWSSDEDADSGEY
jgi:hypothetical protein